MDDAITLNAQAQKIFELMIENLNVKSVEQNDYCRSVMIEMKTGKLSCDEVEDAIDYTVEKQPQNRFAYFSAIVRSMPRQTPTQNELSKEQQFNDFESRRNKLFRYARELGKPIEWSWEHIDRALDAGKSMSQVERQVTSLLDETP
jgi:hypothetical protein